MAKTMVSDIEMMPRVTHQNGRIGPKSTSTSVAPSHAPATGPTNTPPPDAPIGSWLCTEGPYRRYIEALSASNPGLEKADPNNKHVPLSDYNATVVLLDSSAGSEPKFEPTWFRANDVERLKEHLKVSPRDHGRRRVYIMEGLAKQFVAALGDHFFMEPTFFQRHERTCVWSNEFDPTSDALPQPSLLNPDRHVHLQYCELRRFKEKLGGTPSFCHRTNRHMGMTAPRKNETIAIMRRKISWWFEESGTDGWDMVILCDPQLLQFRAPSEHAGRNLVHSAFQGGYNDFIPTPRHHQLLTPEGKYIKSGPTHDSMLGDLVHYFLNHSNVLTKEQWGTSSGAATFPKKIVAAHYLQLVDYIKVMLPSLEVAEQEEWKALQTTSRRCGNYRDDLEDTLLSLGYPVSTSIEKGKYDWADCERDYRYIYFRLQILKERADNLMASMTGLASMAGNQQNLEEAKRLKRLNLLALLFIPLAYTSSLFSMQDEYAPNKSHFWVYWVCALGVVLFTSIVTWILDRALNDKAEWTVPIFQDANDRLKKKVESLFASPSKKSRTVQSGQSSLVEPV